MPIYEYVCTSCEYRFDKLQSMTRQGADCERCGQPARRAISLFASFGTGVDGEPSPVAGMGGCSSCAGGACGCAMD
jgi:putative FmdB family regulatory protein